jgi:hypothetical protein
VGPRCQRQPKEKEKEKERGRGPVRGELSGPAGLAGPKGEKGKVFSFLSFLFQTSFKTTISFQIQIKTLSNFSQKFIDFLETTQATKNHASQMMMHNHLLSLCLLNYV